MTPTQATTPEPEIEIKGNVGFPEKWTVFGPLPAGEPAPPAEVLTSIPKSLQVKGVEFTPEQAAPVRCQVDFKTHMGEPPYEHSQSMMVFIPLESPADQEVTLGMGGDWNLEAWINGQPLFDTMKNGNMRWPPSIMDYQKDAPLRKGRNILAVRFTNGRGSAVLALGGPDELRAGRPRSILPEPPKLDAARIAELYPPDPKAPFRWAPPEAFDPTLPDLGLPHLDEAEHEEIFHAIPSKAAADEGGPGVYESLHHGTWNHNVGRFVFEDRLIALWQNHAPDENGPGARQMAKIGKILNARGDVDWGGDETLVEIAPAPVPVRRRKIPSDRDAVRGAKANGGFREVDGRLLLCGSITLMHGMSSAPVGYTGGSKLLTAPLKPEHFFFGPGVRAVRGGYASWNVGFRFYQEWAIRDDRLQPVSPMYRQGDWPETLALTTELTLPLEPLLPPYCDAASIEEAPGDLRALIERARDAGAQSGLRYRPGTAKLAQDGKQALAHEAQYRRPDGSWVAVREYLRPKQEPVYHGAERADGDTYYPPARRTNLYGAIKPAAGELPDGQVFVVGNSTNRRSMYITVSRDGRVFDRSWFLLHKQLKNYTPGEMKREGGSGSGPQYFVPAVVGESLWLIYSIAKEHIGVTRVPIKALG